MKQSEPLLPKLPSLGELLKHPTVERVVRRVNQTTVAQRAAGFIEELRVSISKRDLVPSLQHLAERLAQRLLGEGARESPLINATGVVCDWQGPVAPLAQTALDEMLQLASEFHDADSQRRGRAEQLLCELTGAESAWIGHNFRAARRLVQECATSKVDAAWHAGLVNPAEWGLPPVETVAERIANGAELLVFDGGGLVGGPRSGIVVGQRQLVQQIQAQPWAEALAADELTLTALEATLRLYRTPARMIHEIPVLQLLSAPLANLQQRAERLAQLMAANEAVDVAQPRAVDSTWLQTADTSLTAPSWIIALRLEHCSAEAALAKWHTMTPRVIARFQGNTLELDLRSVFPRWDEQLLTAVENLTVAK